MLARVFHFLGCRSPEDIMDFAMTGAAALPVMFFLSGYEDQAAVTMLLAVLSVLLVGSWTHGLREAADAEEAAKRKEGQSANDQEPE